MAIPQYLVAIPVELGKELAPAYESGLEARRRDWAGSFSAFAGAYERLLGAQPPGQRFHKGMPLHNMGLARLLAGNWEEGVYYTLLAFLEDAQSKADEQRPVGSELNDPAAHNLVFVFGLPGPWVSQLGDKVRHLVAEGRSFPDPKELAAFLGVDKISVEVVARKRSVSELELARRVEARFSAVGFGAQRGAAIAGLLVDLAVAGQRGLLIVEVLSVDPQHPGGSLQARLDQMHLMSRALPGMSVLGVVEDRWAGIIEAFPGIVSESALVEVANRVIGGAAATPTRVLGPAMRPRVFVAMPFSPAYDDTFYVAIRGAAQALGAVALRVDHNPRTGDVVDRIKEGISAAAVVVADVSEARPSVLHEYGYAEALGRPVLAITSTGVDQLPFNVSHNDTMEYVRGQTQDLRKRLTRRLRAELRRTGHIPQARPRGQRPDARRP